MAFHDGLLAHLKTGATHVAHAWAITRGDGVVLGFTDHDRDFEFETIQFRADSGLSALALEQGVGLASDNSEAIGALSDAAIKESDIDAGRFDGGLLTCWIVNWSDVDQRQILFSGTIGEIRRAGGGFTAELRGLADPLNQPMGRVYQKPCGAVLGNAACGVDLNAPGYATEVPVIAAGEGWVEVAPLPDYEAEWFTRGRLDVLDGAAADLSSAVKRDLIQTDTRRFELWQELRAELAPDDLIRVQAGCDKRMDTCRFKFNNILNYQGFPDIPGEDWLMAQPAATGQSTGGSRR